MLDTLQKLCTLPGVSGCEDAVRSYIAQEIAPFADTVSTDTMGNLIAFRKGSLGNGRRLLLAAHMDEVGVIVRHITKDGNLKFDFVGGIDRRVIIGHRFLLGSKQIPGVVALRAAHLSKDEKSVPQVQELAIDIGASSREEAEALVHLGDYGVFESPVRLLSGGKMLKAKAIDDRIGCAVLLQLIQKTPLWDTYYVFTVQEEVGVRGATIAANRLQTDMALVLEGTTAADIPSVNASKQICHPGKGVVIPFMDRGTIYDRSLFRILTALAAQEGIAWQTKQYIAGGTDAQAIQRSGHGIQTAALAIPVRNIHSSASVASIADMQAMLQLATAFLERLDTIHA